ncbi:hypothetical protein DIZ27_07465 [Streptomyces sp. NWU339]|uniref:hypothetical protein n=1 Tax=Streptomyces sp. NWU339 TaxID=2185284 RepID=UPI000D6782BC|nr:hypothetical protein [Streptomyces sp. NWU339]PWI11219.1 hypothetical protein DIZ27_07465 [Streptomyces sp. NWU339]
MNLVPQVATAEISDADLDSVSGGQAGVGPAANPGLGVHAGAGGLGVHAEAGNIGVTAGLGASVSPEGLSAVGGLAVTQY